MPPYVIINLAVPIGRWLVGFVLDIVENFNASTLVVQKCDKTECFVRHMVVNIKTVSVNIKAVQSLAREEDTVISMVGVTVVSLGIVQDRPIRLLVRSVIHTFI